MNFRQEKTNDEQIENCIIGEKCGTITISIYKETKSGSQIFHVQFDNEEVLPGSNVIEDVVSLY